ncbi:MAG: hypothetical protein AAFO17_07240 [Pseudomonadota bacterium]
MAFNFSIDTRSTGEQSFCTYSQYSGGEVFVRKATGDVLLVCQRQSVGRNQLLEQQAKGTLPAAALSSKSYCCSWLLAWALDHMGHPEP